MSEPHSKRHNSPTSVLSQEEISAQDLLILEVMIFICRFRLLNMRTHVKFAFVRGGFLAPCIVAWSGRISNHCPNQPTGIRISLTGKPNEMAVQWTTRDKSQLASVHWRVDDQIHSFANQVVASSRTYTRADMCGPPANTTGWFDPGWLHYAVLSNLPPGKRIYYRCGNSFDDGEEQEWSVEESFLAPGDHQNSNTPVTILAIADLGQAEVDGSLEVSEMTSALLTTRALTKHVDELVTTQSQAVLIHNGDISYSRGYGTQWDVYWDQLGPIVKRIPYMTTIGNHERDWPASGDRFASSLGYKDSGGECGVAYNFQTAMPSLPPASSPKASGNDTSDVSWYSFDFGPIHFLQYSTEHRFDKESPQYQFIESDLASVNRSRTPWVIVGGHRPMYLDSIPWSPIVADGDQQVAMELREALEPLFIRYRVSATWHGHHHSYQRTCPLAHGVCCGRVMSSKKGYTCGPVHLVIGHAGAELSSNVHLKRPDIFETVQVRHGYLVVQANASHMVYKAYASNDGHLMDEFTMELNSGGNLATQ